MATTVIRTGSSTRIEVIGEAGQQGEQGLQGPTGPNGLPALIVRLSDFAVADAKLVPFVTATAGSPVINTPVGIFTATDVGKRIKVAGVGPAAADLFTTIASYQSATRITLATAATTASNSRGALLGTDCGAGLQAAIARITAARGGTLLIDGVFYLETPVTQNFGTTDGISLTMQGLGWGTGFLIAGNDTKDMISFQNSPRLVIREVNFAGCPMALNDCRRVLNLTSSEFIIERNGFFGVSVAGPDAAAVVYARGCRVRMYDNEYGGCVASSGVGTSVVDIDDWFFVDIARERALDYGRYQGAYLSKTGLYFCFAWLVVRTPHGVGASVNAGSVLRIADCNYDEGHYRGLLISPSLDSRIAQAHLSGIRVNNSLLDGGIGVAIERVDNCIIEQLSIGWANTPHTGLYLNNCGVVSVDGAFVTDGAFPIPYTGMADELVAQNVRSLTLKNAQAFKRRTFTSVGAVQEIIDGVGGVTPFSKQGRITDADFKTPPAIGTVGFDAINNKIYVRTASGWLATTALTTSTDSTFVLNNVTPTTGAVTNSSRYSKTAGGTAWGNATANLIQTTGGSFRMRVSFPSAATANFVRLGMVPASFGAGNGAGQNDFRLGVLQDAGVNIWVIHNSELSNGPYPYTAGQEVQLEYNLATNKYRLLIGGVEKVAATTAPADVAPAVSEHRFTSTLYNVGSSFDLLEYGPLS